MKPLFTGTGTALITPFKNGEIDWDALDNLVESQIAGGVSALIAAGTTGEPSTMTWDEHIEVIRFRRRARERPRLRHCRHGQQLHARGHPRGECRQGLRRGGAAGRHPLLQQVHAGGTGGALHGDCRKDQPADCRLQRSLPHGREHPARDAAENLPPAAGSSP